MLNDIRLDLAENFREGDEAILSKYIDEVSADALSISNREKSHENIKLLSSEIKKCVKSLYLQRGGEGSKSLSDSGKNASFENPYEEMRNSIVKSGKRVPFL